MSRAFAIILSSILTPGAVFWVGQSNPSQNSSQSETAPSSRQSSGASQSTPQQNQNRQPTRRDQDIREQPQGQNTDAATESRNSRRTNNQRDRRDNNIDRTNDLHFIALIAAQHQLQVNVGQIGKERATNDSIRQFASRMVQEHSEFLNQLASISTSDLNDNTNPTDPNTNPPHQPFEAPARPGAPPQLRQPDGSNRPNSTDRPNSTPKANPQQNQRSPQGAASNEFAPSFASFPNEPITFVRTALQRERQGDNKKAEQRDPLVTPGRSPSRSSTDQGNRNSRQDSGRARNNADASTNFNDSRFSSNNPVVQALQQVATRRFALVQSELGNLSGDAFDRAFMQLETALHVDLVASQSALASVSKSRQFQQVLNEGLNMDEEHLGEARRIVAQLLGTDSTNIDTGTNPNLRRPQSTSGDQSPANTRSKRP
jgi:predicted outer membrane protein